MGSTMNSKKGMTARFAAIMFGMSLVAGQASAASVIAGGSVPVINNLITFGNTGLEITTAKTNAVVASFYISNNTPNSFDLSVILGNGGEFVRLGQADGTGLDWSAANLNPGSIGTLGTGLTAVAPAGTGLITPVAAAGGATTAVVWAPGVQTTPTTNYQVNLRGSWAAGASLLAGTYTENVTISLTANM